MKTIFRFLSTGAMTAFILAVGALAGFGQDAAAAATPNPACADVDGQNALYTVFTENFQKKTVAEQKKASDAGKQFLEKYGACESVKEQADYVKPWIPKLEKTVGVLITGETLKPIFKRYDDAIKSDNTDEILAAGKEILNIRKDDINIVVPMALAAIYKSTKDNSFKYADDGIRYATLAQSKIKGGWEFTKKDAKGVPTVGVLKYELTKDQVLGELMYGIAYLNYYGKKDKKSALPLYYELSQSAGYKSDPRVYGTIGDYYIEDGAPIGDEIAKLILEIKNSTDEKVKEDLDGKVKAKIALFNGYTERALDAYTRAHSVAKNETPAQKAYKDNLYKIMQGLYKRRFEKDTGLDAFVASTLIKPFPNPTTPVTPVADPDLPVTTTTTGTTSAAPAAAPPTTAAKPATKPMSTTGTKPATKPMSTVTPKVTTVKKGTRK